MKNELLDKGIILPSGEIGKDKINLVVGGADNQQGAGTAAGAASEGRETALGTPEAMAGTDATEAAGGQQPPPQAGEINLGKLNAGTRPEAMERDEGRQPGGS